MREKLFTAKAGTKVPVIPTRSWTKSSQPSTESPIAEPYMVAFFNSRWLPAR